MNQTQVVERFTSGGTRGSASNMFIEGDVMYSYGRHFPLLVRRDFGYILNGDKHSMSTSGHQAHCRGVATMIIPFSALERANVSPEKLELIDKSQERVDTRQYKDKDGNLCTVEERRPESCVIQQEGRYLLSSMDNWTYFLVELPRPCQTCEEAFDMLVPDAVKGKVYQRQGEWFVIECDAPQSLLWHDAKGMYKYIPKDYELPHRDNGNPHIATRGCEIKGTHYISGQVRHPEHKMLRLSKIDNPLIYQAYENTAINSWSASGRVD